MPAKVESATRPTGGAIVWREVTLRDGRRASVAVIHRPGRGRAVLVRIHPQKGTNHATR